jgi:hypothetical protein
MFAQHFGDLSLDNANEHDAKCFKNNLIRRNVSSNDSMIILHFYDLCRSKAVCFLLCTLTNRQSSKNLTKI